MTIKRIFSSCRIKFNYTSLAEVLADSGFDWRCIDLEHSTIVCFDVQLLILSIQRKRFKGFVLVGENNS